MSYGTCNASRKRCLPLLNARSHRVPVSDRSHVASDDLPNCSWIQALSVAGACRGRLAALLRLASKS